MSSRLPHGGRLIDRSRRLAFRFNGKRLNGFAGDTLASALLGNGQMLMGRSFKYHRPRGVVASGPEEPNALMGVGRDQQFEPNQRATVQPLRGGLEARSQNHWPTLEFDVGEVNAKLSKFLPAGFYYKTFMWPAPFWKWVFEPVIRASAGLGRPPEGADADTYEHVNLHVDLAIVGGGIAGLQAALVAGRAGRDVLLMEQTDRWGGRAPVDGDRIAHQTAQEWIDAALDELSGMPNVRLRLATMGAGVYDHGYLLAYEEVSAGGGRSPRQRLWRIRARHIVTATGAIERPIPFANNDVPGVVLASAMRDFVVNYGVAMGDRTVLVTNNDDAYRTALALVEAGLSVPVILDVRPEVTGDLPARAREKGIRIETGKAVSKVLGGKHVEGVAICAQAGDGAVLEEVPCDAVAMSGGWSPVPHLWSHCGGKNRWDAGQAHFAPDPDRAPTGADGEAFVTAVGAAAGTLQTGLALRSATERMGALVDAQAETPEVDEIAEAPLQACWMMPAGASYELRSKMFLDYQNDVKVSDVQLAAQEGFVSVEHTKRYTTLGMATDQGKLSNINGLAILAQELGEDIPNVGTTTFRPPYAPISMGSIAGEARGEIFQPLRRTPIHDWHEAHGAVWEPVGHWRRPYAYPNAAETAEEAVQGEVRNTRENVGLLDASTLGKIIVSGPDAGRFLDMMYTNMMSTLKPGKCRYGLMCSENGFLMDDGVVARLDDNRFLCHTTSGGADRIHAHMEEWLQTEWWEWKVHVVNATEQYAQIAVVGPRARDLLTRLGGMDLSAEALPFMGWAEGEIAGIPVRVFRISFSGELSFEVAAPAGQGRALWDALVAAGERMQLMPYGTEALHIMRAEKGFIMIGDETDGTIIPQDLNLDWAISKKKDDFLGKRGQERSYLSDPDRWKLVGLETLDGSVVPDGAYAVDAGKNANGQRNTQGRVTSSYHSPTLDRGIAMALVRNGPDRMGEVLTFPVPGGEDIEARICDPVFYDKEGTKQNV